MKSVHEFFTTLSRREQVVRKFHVMYVRDRVSLQMQVNLRELALHLHSRSRIIPARRRNKTRSHLRTWHHFALHVPFTARLWDAWANIIAEMLVGCCVKVTVDEAGRSSKPARHESQRTCNVECDELRRPEGREDEERRPRIFYRAATERARLCE